jgi:lantibiotic biosynthesis protein
MMPPVYRVPDDPLVYVRTPQFSVDELGAIFAAEDPLAHARALFAKRGEFRTALAIASPVLFRQFDRDRGARADRRAALRALAYAVRMASRCTPFGTFALVGGVEMGPQTTLSFDPGIMVTRTRIDMAYVETYATAVEALPERRNELEVVASESVMERGARLHIVHARRTTPSRTAPGAMDHTAISVRRTAAVDFVRAFAATPHRLDEIAAAVSARFGIGDERAQRLVDALYDAGLLLSTIRPYPVSGSREALGRNDDVLAGDFAPAVRAAAAFDEAAGGREPEALARAVEALPQPPSGDLLPFQIDAARVTHGTLGAAVLRDVEELARISTHGELVDPLKDYAQSFLARYEGMERLVPLLELTDPELGLGAPPDSMLNPAEIDPKRQTALLELYANAMRRGEREIDLRTEDLPRYIGPPLPDRALPPTIEMGVVIAARDAAAIDRGEYLIAPCAGFITDGAARSFGRFADVLPPAMLGRAVAALRRNAPAGCIEAELVYATAFGRVVNVAQRPPMVEYEIVAGFAAGSDPRRLPLSDLVVGLNADGFAVYSRALRKRVLVRESHLTNTPDFAPGPIRFLSLLARKPSMMHGGFRWHRLGKAPYLPRVRCARLVLALARWNVPVGVARDEAALARWLETWAVDPVVVLCARDNRLVLDLRTALGRELLRDQTDRQGVTDVVLEEMLVPVERHWLRARGRPYSAEFVFSLERTQPAVVDARARDRVVPAAERVRAPMSDWVYLKCYAPRDRADDVIARAIAPVIAEAEQRLGPLPWFFVRYADPRFHLRIRVACGTHAAEVMALLAHVMQALIGDGELERFSFDTYEREVERYGGSEAMHVVEQIFCAHSRLAAAALASGIDGAARRMELAVDAVYAFLRGVLAPDELDGWLRRNGRKPIHLDRPAWETVRRLRAAHASGSDPAGRAGTAYAALTEAVRGGALTIPFADLVASVVHMEFNRYGIDGQAEAVGNQMVFQLHSAIRGSARAGASRRGAAAG